MPPRRRKKTASSSTEAIAERPASPLPAATAEAPKPGNADELAAVAAQVRAQQSAGSTATPPPAAERPPLEDGGAEAVAAAADLVEEIATKPAAEVDALIARLTEEELASVVELGFGLVADSRGAHWDINEKRALRIARWLKLSIERHGALAEWLAKFLPELMLALLLGYEIWIRWRVDQELAKKKEPASAASTA